ncbi:MAG: hypothetical protein A2939_01440 [Parcubacteria group bacterium RIFCSPLOWO2_01_FULL_48_18]|nr:MAG: hypothetical protein A2939_01440 [Parcubacteria group bacterium RIFCSPLOWO2_01_FULL_48_18]OHB22130.1 MAG: hypothetical protein A3J67_04390 [Parcubacteria group bacterium RIFCSPHIGHO2_02_FULL_48_10b]
MKKDLMYLFFLAVVVILLWVGGYIFIMSSPTWFTPKPVILSLPSSLDAALSNPTENSSQVHIVLITKDGFSPKTTAIHVDDVVRWINIDTGYHWPASDPHPTHTALAGFDASGNLASGETYSYQFEQPGYFVYHDHAPALAGEELIPIGLIEVLVPDGQ